MKRLKPNPEKQGQTQIKVAKKRTCTRNASEQRTTRVKIVHGGRRCKHGGTKKSPAFERSRARARGGW